MEHFPWHEQRRNACGDAAGPECSRQRDQVLGEIGQVDSDDVSRPATDLGQETREAARVHVQLMESQSGAQEMNSRAVRKIREALFEHLDIGGIGNRKIRLDALIVESQPRSFVVRHPLCPLKATAAGSTVLNPSCSRPVFGVLSSRACRRDSRAVHPESPEIQLHRTRDPIRVLPAAGTPHGRDNSAVRGPAPAPMKCDVRFARRGRHGGAPPRNRSDRGAKLRLPWRAAYSKASGSWTSPAWWRGRSPPRCSRTSGPT